MIETVAWRFGLLGYRASFAQPLLLLLAGVALALGAVALVRQRAARKLLERLVTARMLPRLAPGRAGGRGVARSLLACSGLLLFALALAQPQCGTRTQRIQRRGVDVLVALDASKSMLARDVKPNRLERAKLELGALLDQLKGDRVGLVAFAGDAFVQCPLTSDYAAARLFLRAVDPEQMPQGGTHVGAALRLAHRVLTTVDRGAKEQVVVLLSDGEDLAGQTAEAGQALREAGIPVLVVGIGSEEGEPIPLLDSNGEVTDYQRDASGNVVLTKLDRAALEALAQSTGGEYFYRPQGVAVAEVAARIDRMQKSDLESRLTVEYDERYELFAWPGLLLWTAAMLLRPSRRTP